MSKKPARRTTVVFFLLLSIACCSFLVKNSSGNAGEINKYYSKKISDLGEKLATLHDGFAKQESVALLKKKFLQARLAYKRLAILTEYYSIVQSRLLNGAAIDRTEEDNPDIIVSPHGFQVIETFLYGEWQNEFYEKAGKEVKMMLEVLNMLDKQTDREFLFRDPLAWDAIRSASVRLITLGITGYDSPVAMLSLPEASATIKGMKSILSIFKANASKKTFPLYNSAFAELDNALSYLKANNDFNSFNRLEFITRFINPFYKTANQIRVAAHIPAPDGSYPVNFNATSIFSDSAFNINFFSPGEDYKVTSDRIRLGKKLFYNPLLSGTKDRSCASCHKPGLAFTDGLKTALAIDHQKSLLRNTPTLLNAGLQSHQFFDSRSDILENQLEEVVHNSDEMKGSLVKSIGDLRTDSDYARLFRRSYPRETDPLTGFNIANAISSYIRSLKSLNSRFDQYMRGEKTKLSDGEKKGFNLFMGKAKCATCHHPPLFNGLLPSEFTETESEVLGVPETADTVNPRLDRDEGKFLFTRSKVHRYSFKTPTLRNIALTAPYMHNGIYKTLKEVVDFYNKGGGKGLKIAPGNQTLPFDRLNLSERETGDIIKFMKSLTDNPYANQQ